MFLEVEVPEYPKNIGVGSAKGALYDGFSRAGVVFGPLKPRRPFGGTFLSVSGGRAVCP